MKENNVKQSPIAGLSGYGGGAGSVIFGRKGVGGYQIKRSLRFNSGDQAYLNRTPSTSGNRRTFTFACWIKRSKLVNCGSSGQEIFRAGDSALSAMNFAPSDGPCDALSFKADQGGVSPGSATNAVFRDFSAWFHVVYRIDTTQSTASNRVRLYVNGVEQTWHTTNYPSQNQELKFNQSGQPHYIGGKEYLDGYLADIHFIDGQSLDPSNFGETNDDGIWDPKKYTGSFGTNGFYLKFDDASSDAALGTDSSGNNNTWTVYNLAASDFTATFLQGNTSDLSGTPFNSSYALSNLFDSDKTNRIAATGNSSIVYTPSPAITADSFRIHYQLDSSLSGYGLKVNDVDYTSSLSVGSNKQIDINVQTLNKVEIRTDSSNQWCSLYYIEKLTSGSGPNQDSLFDSPADGTQSDTGAGGEVSANYPTWNPLDNGGVTLANGNLDASHSASNHKACRATVKFPESGKWYYEATITTLGSAVCIGLDTSGAANPNLATSGANFILVNSGNSVQRYLGSGFTDFSSAFGNPSVGSILQVAYDADADKLWLGMNNVWMGSGSSANGNPGAGSEASASSITSGFPVLDLEGTSALAVNFGQRSFSYAAPTNFKALCTTNLPDPTIADGSAYFDTKLYTGNGSSVTVSNVEFSPDFVWLKGRSDPDRHGLFDTVRGATKRLQSSETTAEDTQNGVTAFNSDGFAIGNYAEVNGNGRTYAAWAWNAGANSNRTYTVKVVSDSGNKYRFDGHGTSAVTLDLAEGSTYVFDQSDSSNGGHPLRFSTTANGTHGGGTEYTTGVTVTGTPGQAGAKTTIVIAAGAPTLYYYCTNHSGMGGQINTNSTAGATVLSGSLNSSGYDQTTTWSSLMTGHSQNAASAFDGNGTTYAEANSGATIEIDLSTYSITATSRLQVMNDPAFTGSTDVQYKIYTTSSSTPAFSKVIGGTQSFDEASSNWSSAAITKITVRGLNEGARISKVIYDGVILVNASTTPPNLPSINSVMKASTEAGFSVFTYTGTGTAGTVGHGLNTAPEFYILKSRSDGEQWAVYHKSITALKKIVLDSTAAQADTNHFNDTEPTNSVLSIGSTGTVNVSGSTYLGYAFTSVEGFSAFGSYTGNGSSDGPFVYTGFRPALIITKRTDSSGGWVLWDTARNPSNVATKELYPDDQSAEYTGGGIDILSNGFKLRNSSAHENNNGGSYIYAAFAENPFKTARAR